MKAMKNLSKILDNMLTMLEEIATEKNKIPALTEFGYGQFRIVPGGQMFSRKHCDHHKISYALAWRNAGFKPSGEAEFYFPYKGRYLKKIL